MGNPYDLSIRNILIFVLYSVVLICMFVILARRQIKRMRLRYDKNFENQAVKSFPKSYREELQTRIDKAVEPKFNPVLVRNTNFDRSALMNDNETVLRMKALFVVDNCFQNRIGQEDIKINPQEDIIAWYDRITAPGKLSNLQVDSFQTIVKLIHRNYIHARHEPETFTLKHFDEIEDSCSKAIDKLNTETNKKKNRKKKKMKTTDQIAHVVRKGAQGAATVLNPFSRKSEEHQKLL